MEKINLFTSSVLAGICISIGCIVNVMSGGGIAGAVLFTFGLITVVHYKYALYTGTAGFMKSFTDLSNLFTIILTGNVIGCLLSSLAFQFAFPSSLSMVDAIVEKRFDLLPSQAFIRAMFCGFLMTTAVKFAREERWLPLLFAVPVFILSGFYHSIADSFYFISSGSIFELKWHYLLEILGNFVGCNIYRLNFYENMRNNISRR